MPVARHDLELAPHPPGASRAVLDEHRFAGVISLTAHGGATAP